MLGFVVKVGSLSGVPMLLAGESGGGSSSVSLSTLTDELSSSFGGIATEMMIAIGKVLPVVLPVMGGIALVTIAIHVFKKVAR